MDEGRLKHSYTVATKMVEIGRKKNLSDKQIEELFALGLNHDIGYEFGPGNVHGEVGAEILKRSGYKFWQEVYYHGKADSEYESMYLDILNAADMSVDSKGNDVGVDKRLKDIKSRYGEESNVYQCCIKLVNKLKEKGEL